ncbi:hypothetical protein H5410_004937 [Solanum commersonii]|uniref:At2g35280-like TPR domain-containing protein n=1 Tax=Solanum commersonii TaxID=4109 RepID=A0A9J6A6P1_SOLCO|nr:hypothetical protein H5410_004937 [Solanum commersonii]
MKTIYSSFESLDWELLDQIVERVTSISYKDLINFRLSCKIFNEIGSERWVYRNVVKNYFRNRNTDETLEMLDKASKGGHTPTRYAFGIISIFLGGESTLDGIQMIGKMKVTQEQKKITRQCRQRLLEI